MKAILFLSGGFDSPIAGYLMNKTAKESKKEFNQIALHFSGEPFTTKDPEIKSIECCKILGIKQMFVADFGNIQSEIVKKCEHRYYYILTRRLMMMIANKLAETHEEFKGTNKTKFIITGENLGQVGSQTLSNISTISEASRLPILRPVLCYDKQEIIDLAKKIKTYETCCGPEMCSVLGPKHPATSSNLGFIKKQEENLDVDKIVDDCVENIREVKIK